MGSALREWGIAAFSAFALFGSSYLVIRAGRRDKYEDRHAKLEEKVNQHDSRIAAIESALEWIRKLFKQP